MPELKRTFQAGKMNRNQDERLLQPGEYREAQNINIGRSETSDIGSVENVLGNVEITNSNKIDGTVIGSHRDNGNERIFFFVTDNDSDIEDNPDDAEHGIFVYNQRNGQINLLAQGSFLNFHTNNLITGINFVDDLLFWTDNRNEPRKINVTRALNQPDFYNSDDKTAVIKIAPIAPPTVERVETTGNDSAFLQEKFVRFAYRYKFNDGEFSTISPFTPIVFKSLVDRTLTETDFLAGGINDFINQAKQVFLEVEVPVNAGITGVEILYNESSSTNVYILEELAAETDDLDSDDPITVNYTYDSQDPFRALPASQLTRVYDAVPRLALSQEFAGGRLIYGNFLQNYNLPSLSFNVTTASIDNDTSNVFNRFSVKSQRTYQVGIVLADRFGRQSPVILSSTGGDTIFVSPETGVDAMQQLQIEFNNPNAIPDWAYSYRIVVKQRQQEYYNFFYSSRDNDLFEITGGNINKVPRDTTDETVFVGNIAVAQSIIKLHPKGAGASATGLTNTTGTEVVAVDSILYDSDNPGGFPQARIYNSGLTGDFGVFETSPRESQLDIFYETSTAGLIEDIGSDAIPVDFYNCYILNIGSSHLELNRIRAEFNAPWLTVGLKAYATQENFAETRRFNTLIHSSGLFSSRVGQNNINQFNEAEGGLTVSLDPADGSVQKLYAEDTQVIIFQEDKVSRSPVDKDFIYSAEGGAVPVTSSTQYLGTIAPYAGEYGISKNPESFAVYGTRKYFTDANRGVALRLSNNGLTEISENGLADFFRDALDKSSKVIGSFDEYHDQYNCTIVGIPAYGGFDDTNIATGKSGYFTVSFEEEVNGWPAFKTFQQEGGTTLNNRYYTFYQGGIWEHNTIDAQYNNFYGVVSPSYMECIFNDSPSDVKEFKTVNYEGLEGWTCHTVETDLETYTVDEDANELSDIITARLNISESVNDGQVSGVQTQTVVRGDEYKWVIKIQPSTSDFVFDDTSNVTVTVDGDALDGTLVNNNLYFITDTYTAGNDDQTLNVVIEGAAIRDTSGAILIIRVVDNIEEDDISVIATPSNNFRGGITVFEYVTGDENTNVEVEVEIDADSEYEINGSVITTTFGDSIANLISGTSPAVFSNTKWNIERAVELPSVQTNGTVAIGTSGDVLAKKPVITLETPTLTGDNYTVQYVSDGELHKFDEDIDLGSFTSGGTVELQSIYVVPDFEDNNENVLLAASVDVTSNLTVAKENITQTDIDDDNLPGGATLIGAVELTATTGTLVKGTDRDDTTNDVDVTFAITATTRPVDQWLFQVDGSSVTEITVDPADVTQTITNDDFKSAYYYVIDASNNDVSGIGIDTVDASSIDDKDSGEVFFDGETHDLTVESSVANGTYRMFFVPISDETSFRGNNFSEVQLTIIVDDGS